MNDDRIILRKCRRNDNVFGILADCMRAGKEAGWTKMEIDDFVAEATSNDHEHLLKTVDQHFILR